MLSRFSALALSAVLLGAAPSGAQTARPALDLKTAEAIRDHCLARARTAGHAIAIAVYDRAGNLVTFARMDETSTAVSEVARWKGESAASFLRPTTETGQWNAPMLPRVATVGGGVPIFDPSGYGLGGVGVSGGPVEFDVECGTSAITAAKLLAARIK